MFELANLTTLIMIIGILVGLTNIFTEVLKKVWDNFPSSLLALVIALSLTLIAYFGYNTYNGFAVTWYYVIAAVVVGFMVAYAAMFGFDKLKEIVSSWQYKN